MCWFVAGAQRISLPPRVVSLAKAYVGKPVILGVRPEGLSPSHEGKFAGDNNHLTARINVIEPLGDKVDIYLAMDGSEATRLTCRADAYEFGKLERGGTIPFFLDLAKIHLFEAGENGRNLTLGM